MLRFLLPLLLLLCNSCYLGEIAQDQPLDPEAISQLQPGTNTASDVVRLLGAPNQVVELGDGSAWLYQATNAKSMGLWLLVVGSYGNDAQADRCWVFFDSNGILTHYGATLNANTSEYSISGF
ncbi:MAG: outer membrane protein assembly factor BamE [Planctomycetota bacterium]|nr:outer membrane protein assembly factor BamE [Planctomycetota bacterium]